MTLESRTVFVTDKNNKPRKLTYDLERKQVKNINLRIRSDETLFVSASPHVAVKTIDDFILTKEDGVYITLACKRPEDYVFKKRLIEKFFYQRSYEEFNKIIGKLFSF